MGKTLWYILAQKGSEFFEDADVVSCENDDTIAGLKQAVPENNMNTLSGVDSRELEVFEYGENGTRCQGQTKLSKCTSGTDEQPFRIFYQGIHVKPRILELIIHRTLHATSSLCRCGA